jgi:hypothetical protein
LEKSEKSRKNIRDITVAEKREAGMKDAMGEEEMWQSAVAITQLSLINGNKQTTDFTCIVASLSTAGFWGRCKSFSRRT